jgi:four helix bundle protein
MVKHFRELRVYQDAFAAAMKIYQLSKSWPQEERYSLTDQIRRASRSASTNIAEAWRKRRYPAHFTSKLSDADSETAETQAWLDHAHACGYLSKKDFSELDQIYEGVSGGLVAMMDDAESWCGSRQETPTPHPPRRPHS